MAMDSKVQESENVLFCPVASLYSLSIYSAWDKDSKMISDCFRFNSEVGPGWIQYDPTKITAITCNDMFIPISKSRDIVQPKKQMIKIVTPDDVSTLEAMLEKPVLMCVTRPKAAFRHPGGSLSTRHRPPQQKHCQWL